MSLKEKLQRLISSVLLLSYIQPCFTYVSKERLITQSVPTPEYPSFEQSKFTKKGSIPVQVIPQLINDINDDPPQELCLQYSFTQFGRCLECIKGYGPYPTGGTNYECRPCIKDEIKHCEKCQWLIGEEENPKYYCMNCTYGFYPLTAVELEAPEHYGKSCAKCPENCVDCMTQKYCTLCPFDRETYLPPNYYAFEPVRYCRYYFKYKMMYLGVFVYFTFMAFLLLKKLFCGYTSIISKKFVGSTQQGAPDLGKLMKSKPIQKKSKNAYREYTPTESQRGQSMSWRASELTYRNKLSVAGKE